MTTPQEIIKKYNLTKHKWVHKGAHSVLHLLYPASVNLLNPLKEYWGDSFRLFVFFIIEDYLHWYYNEKDMTRLRTSIVDRLNNEPQFLERFEKEWRHYVNIFEEKCKKVDDTALSSLSDKELLELYTELYNAYVKEYSIAMGLLESFSMQVDTFFRPMLEKVLVERESAAKKAKSSAKKDNFDDFNVIYSTLLSPIDQSFINQEFKGRLQIIKAIANGVNKNNINNLLKNHAKTYFWIENNYAKVKILNADYFREKIENEIKLGIDPEKEIKKIGSCFLEIKKKKEELIKKLKLNKEMINIIRATEVFSRMQDDRKKCVLISNHYQKLFLAEIGKRTGLSEKEMDYTIFPEIPDILLKKRVNKKGLDILAERKKQLTERKKATLCIETLDGYDLFSGDIALKIFDKVFKPKISNVELKGVCASPGNVKGIVKIVRKTHDLASVNKGDILVASMTRPEMVVAMEKASAIVTDEGGVTCHAAVIARELKIPCIIGTKNATTLLKNGDLVEVDANKGIIKIIKKT